MKPMRVGWVVTSASYRSAENAVGVKNWFSMLATIGFSASVAARFAIQSGSA
jgi:hypothetical protein